MLTDAKLPHSFWAEAVSAAVYLRNRSPTKALKDMTPFEAWTEESSTYVFLALMHILSYQKTKENNLSLNRGNVFL